MVMLGIIICVWLGLLAYSILEYREANGDDEDDH